MDNDKVREMDNDTDNRIDELGSRLMTANEKIASLYPVPGEAFYLWLEDWAMEPRFVGYDNFNSLFDFLDKKRAKKKRTVEDVQELLLEWGVSRSVLRKMDKQFEKAMKEIGKEIEERLEREREMHSRVPAERAWPMAWVRQVMNDDPRKAGDSGERVDVLGNRLAARICAEVDEIGNKAPEEEGREHEPDD